MKEAMIFKMKLKIRRLLGEGVRELESVGGKMVTGIDTAQVGLHVKVDVGNEFRWNLWGFRNVSRYTP
jgi:hypothetical protein